MEPSAANFSSKLFLQDTKIASLERNIRDLEDEIQMLKANGLLSTEDREEEIKQMEVYKNHSKFMKTKVLQPDAAEISPALERECRAGDVVCFRGSRGCF